MVPRLARHVPNLLTLLGHALTLAWILGAPGLLGLVGLVCDALDGWTARRLRAITDFGRLYDWTVDVTVASLLVLKLGWLPLLLVLVPLQVHLHQAQRHVSGRAVLVLLCLVAQARG